MSIKRIREIEVGQENESVQECPVPVPMHGRLFDNLITIDEFLASLCHQYKRRTIYKWIKEGLPCQKIRGRLWIHADKARRWLQHRS